MPSTARFRERVQAVPPGNRVFLGKLEVFQDTPGPQNRLIQTVDHYSASSSWSGLFEKCWDQTNPGPPFMTGGPLTSVKTSLPHHVIKGVGVYESPINSDPVDQGFGTGHHRYTGGWGDPDFFGDNWNESKYSTLGYDQSDPNIFKPLGLLAAGAYAKLRPKIEHAGMGVALAEARDIPRMMKGTAKQFSDIWNAMGGRSSGGIMQPKRLSNDFLNIQFGWIPFLNDMRQFYDVYQNSKKYIARLRRDNNQWVKRYRNDKIIESETYISFEPGNRVNPGPGFQLGAALYSNNPQSHLIQRTSTQVWYEGRFKYYRSEFDESRPGSDSLFGDIQRQMTLYGARISPSNIYKATPWTWLIDWFTNVGDVVDRASDAGMDGVVSKYMYLMHHDVREIILRQFLHMKYGGTLTMDFSRKADIKRRVSADTPYGFGLTWETLSPRQLAILGALGISRRQVV